MSGLTYTHMYAGDDGLTHFKEVELDELTDEKTYRVTSPTIPATGLFFRNSGGDYSNDFHNTPAKVGRTFVVILEGALEIVASDGTSRIFNAGDVFLQDDLTGKGHYTKAVNGQPRRTLFVTID